MAFPPISPTNVGFTVLLVQETWLFNFQHSSIENILCGSQYHAVLAMDESAVCRAGRPYGGCAVILHRSLALAFRPVPTRSPPLCAVANNSDSDTTLVVANWPYTVVYLSYNALGIRRIRHTTIKALFRLTTANLSSDQKFYKKLKNNFFFFFLHFSRPAVASKLLFTTETTGPNNFTSKETPMFQQRSIKLSK